MFLYLQSMVKADNDKNTFILISFVLYPIRHKTVLYPIRHKKILVPRARIELALLEL